MHTPWYITAIGAALIWGIHYPLIDNALRKISLMSVLLLTALPIVLVAPLFYRTLAEDYRLLAGMAWGEKAPMLALGLTSLIASFLLFLSIGSKNATFASLIEITYPVFVAIFAYLLFNKMHVNPSMLLGGLLVFAGVAIIILNNP